MLYKRYGDPIGILSTFSMKDVGDFFLYLFDKDNEETLWDIWLAKDIEDNFTDFKKDKLTSVRQKKVSGISEEEVSSNILDANRFIKANGEGG